MATAYSDDSSNSHHAPKSRRSHKKSRNGCGYCKRRRIKCDEAKPVCGHCARLSLPCVYSPDGQVDLPIITRGRGRPRKNWASEPPKHQDVTSIVSSAGVSPSSVGSPEQPLEASIHLPWGVIDLELFYHYTTTVAAGAPDAHLWQDILPRLAFRRPSVLHLTLAISAFHMARRETDRSAELTSRADAHMNIGLHLATRALTDLNEQNCVELYISTILISTCTFAKKPEPGHLLVVAEGQEVAWWELFRGVRIVIETMGMEKIMAIIADEAKSVMSSAPSFPASKQVKPDYIIFKAIEWETAVDGLSYLVGQLAGEQKVVCQKTLGMLLWCFEDTFGRPANPELAADAKLQTTMAWLYVLDDEYVTMLKEKHPVALVLLAYFAVLLQTLESVWFLRGWSAHIVQGVSDILGTTTYAPWIRWPMSQVEKGLRFIKEVENARLETGARRDMSQQSLIDFS